MIGPSVADAAVTPKVLQEVLGRAVQRTLHMVSVDGEMSTNDTVLVLAIRHQRESPDR